MRNRQTAIANTSSNETILWWDTISNWDDASKVTQTDTFGRTTIGKQFIGIVDKSIASTIQWNSDFLRVFVAFLFFCELKKPQWKAHLNVGVPCFVFPRRATTNWCFNKWSSLGDDVFPSSNCWGEGALAGLYICCSLYSCLAWAYIIPLRDLLSDAKLFICLTADTCSSGWVLGTYGLSISTKTDKFCCENNFLFRGK